MKIGSKILNTLYPRCCPICHNVMKITEKLICQKCLDKLQPIEEPRCMKCGKPLEQPEKEYCRDCTNYQHKFVRGMAIYPYDRIMKKSIEKYKFQGRREYGDFYAQAMAHYGNAFVEKIGPQCLVPVPMLPRKQRLRGYNQAEYLAQRLGELWNIPVEKQLVERIYGGKNQKELSASQRRRNLSHAFRVVDDHMTYDRILIIDDVYTTGSTIDAVAGALEVAGVENVYFLTLCQGKGL